ncbi:MAG: hypothetical protein EBR30_08920 [Cytophagia bacterium]|nr:hypothetical protein [Cytophagia bacterium]NBW35123.1 hypothetical protein [Cytophagia bacterium]
MKVGFVFECQPKGSDEQVYTYVAKQLCNGLDIRPENISCMGNKKTLIEESATDVAVMLANGCEYVFIIWDRIPKWGGSGVCADHQAELTANLQWENVNLAQIIFCCIDEMLESWLIADGRGVTNYFQAINHLSPKFNDHSTRAEQTSPKDRLTRYNGRYNESVHNIGIVKALPDFSRAARWNSSFKHFVDNINQICPQTI